MGQMLYPELSYAINGALFEVAKHLGPGLLEKTYQEALEVELTDRDIPFEREKHIEVYYKDHLLPTDFYADFVIDDKVVVELKAVEKLCDAHRAQVVNYLRLTGCELGLLVNFNKPKIDIERLVNYFDYDQ